MAKIVILGLSITSSWGNGHATTYRGLVRALHQRGHNVLFLERDVPWYAANRDLAHPPYGTTQLYTSVAELQTEYAAAVRSADLVLVGSYVPEGVAVGSWVIQTAQSMTAFYDIDTPVTLAKLAAGDYEYLDPALIPLYDCYLSFTGGATLTRLETEFGSPMARPLYCAVDPQLYAPQAVAQRWTLGYLGTYSPDRQPALETLLLQPAQQWPSSKFVVAGPQYPATLTWPANVERIDHLAPAYHAQWYSQQSWTLNLTRADMVRAGYAPSVRLFEAAACGTPIISDYWTGLETFFTPNEEIMIAADAATVLDILRSLSPAERTAISTKARARVLREHTAAHRAHELESYFLEWQSRPRIAVAALSQEVQ